jgi:hypothetical protein
VGIRISSTVSLESSTYDPFRAEKVSADVTVRVLAESQWSGQVPDDLQEQAESQAREVMRIQKARVAMGELDTVGRGIWDNISPRPRMGRVVSESVLVRSSPGHKYVFPSL